MQNNVFWKNIPDVEDYWPPTNLTEEYSRLCYDDSQPVVVFFGPGSIDLSEIELTPHSVEYLEEHPLHIYSQEPLAWYDIDNPEFSLAYYSEFDKDIDLDSIRAQELDSIQEFLDSNDLSRAKIFVGDGGPLEDLELSYPKIKVVCGSSIWVNFIPGEKIVVPEQPITKKFFCANRRFTPQRLLVTAYLMNKSSNVSWFYNTSLDLISDINWFDSSKYQDARLSQMSAGAKILNQQTFYLDSQTDSVVVNDLTTFNDVPAALSPNFELSKFCKSSFLTVVGETRFAQPFAMMTEKTTIPAVNKRPFVLCAPPGTLELVQSLGFKTFRKWWSESYDTIRCPNRRLNAIFDIIDYIDGLAISELEEMLEEMEHVLEHNYQLALSYSTANNIELI